MNFNIFQWRSLQTRVTLTTLLIFLLSIWLLSYYTSRMLREDMERVLGEQQFSMASFIAAEINQELDGRLRALETIAAGINPATLGDPASLQGLLEQLPILQSRFNGGVIAYRLDGTAVAETLPSTGRIDVNYMNADAIATAINDGKSTIGRPLMSAKLHVPVFNMAAPIRDTQGTIIGALAGVINLSQSSFLNRITASRYGKSGHYFLNAPQHRLIVTSSDKSRIMQALPPADSDDLLERYAPGREGYGIFMNFRGVEVLTAAKGVPVAGWFMRIALPTAEAFAPIRAMQQRMLLATIFLTLLAGGLTWWMLRRQLSPLLSAAARLATMLDAKQPAQPLPIVRQDEIGALIGGFNHLLKTLGQREAFLKQILDTSSVAIFLVDMEGRLTQANQRMAEMFEYHPDALEGKEYIALLHPAEREAGRQNLLALLGSAIPSVDLERRYCRDDQSTFWGHLTGRRFYDVNGEERGLIGVIADITERKQAEEKLHLAASVFTHAREGIVITAASGEIIDVNDTFTRITGYRRDEVLGQNPRLLSSGRHTPEFYANLWHDLATKDYWSGEIWNRRKNGEIYIEMKTISAVRDAQGNIQQYVALFSDITTLKEHEKHLEHIAHYDTLTTLPNRVLLADRLQHGMTLAKRHGKPLAVIYLDLDGFKAINDSHGHDAGDQLLMALSAGMKQTLREGDTLARLGGDEFVAVLLDLPDAAARVPLFTRLLTAAAQPVHIGDLVLQVSASLGVTVYPQAEEVDADQLLRQADQAMYQAKLAGKNRYHIFDAEHDRSVRGHNEDLERIRSALAAREFVLYYQPKVNMRTGTVIGAEALIRWQHPEKGLLPPAQFLPVIEDHPLSVELGAWVINSALDQMALWRAAGLIIPVSVNVSASQLQQADFPTCLRISLAAHPDVEPGQLELEVLETSALEDLTRVSQIMQACRELGVSFAMDDFGTGYSSLTYLKRLPVALLKIDQSFVRDMLDDPDDLAILEGVIGLAGTFHRQVIAEGVETVQHGEMLLQLGCELAQGYGIARPMPARELPGWAAAWRPDPAWLDVPTMNRQDLPLLFAGVEHRAWITAMENHLHGAHAVPPALDHHQCRFGSWLDSEGMARYAEQPAFLPMDALHQQVHALAIELCALHNSGKTSEAVARLAELYDLRDALLRQLNTLARHISANVAPIAPSITS